MWYTLAENGWYIPGRNLTGINLYAYCGNNPIMFADPSGLRPPTASESSTLNALSSYRGVGSNPISPSDAMRAVDSITSQIAGLANGAPLPPNLQALFWGLNRLGDGRYSKGGTLPGLRGMQGLGTLSDKCNYFVGYAYGVGANTGFGGPNGYPTTVTTKFWIHHSYPIGVAGLGDSSKRLQNLSMYTDSRSTSSGDIYIWSNGSDVHHAALFVGGNLYINAGGNDGVVIRTFDFIDKDQRNGTTGVHVFMRKWK